MDGALTLADTVGLDERRKAAAVRGLLHGLGVAYAVEIAGGPQGAPGPEAAEIRFDEAGDATVILGSHNHGQGHETAFRQLAGDLLGLAAERIRFVFGDTDAIASGIGTFGSRTAATAGAALAETAKQIVELGGPHAAALLEARPEDIVFAEGYFTVRGTDHRIGTHEVAAVAARESGDGGFGAGAVAAPENCTYPNACHVCEVEVDPETGHVVLTRYAVVDDVGRVLNPLLLEGQFHGGIVQGIGQILHEEIVFDPHSGQQLTGSFMDYCLPRADDLPPIAIRSHELPSANSPFGVKGAGEAGTVGSMPAVMNAVCDALARAGVRRFDMPATPERVWRALKTARK